MESFVLLLNRALIKALESQFSSSCFSCGNCLSPSNVLSPPFVIPSQSPLSSPSEWASRRTMLRRGPRHREMFSLWWNWAGSVEKRAFHRISSSRSLIWGLCRFVLRLVLLALSVAGLPLKYAEPSAPETSFADMIWTNLTSRLCPRTLEWRRVIWGKRLAQRGQFIFFVFFFLLLSLLGNYVRAWTREFPQWV